MIEKNENGFDAKELFSYLANRVEEDKKNGIEITRTHPAQKILNRFSGQYISPTMVKSFDCPAGSLASSLYPSKGAASVGTTVHSILNKFYDEEKSNRNRALLKEITREMHQIHELKKEQLDVINYIKGFWEADDYLGGVMKHDELDCTNEYFLAETCAPLGVSIPLKIYSVLDRLDFRDEMYIIDYKTGKYFSNLDDYLPQLMCYGWTLEEKYGEKCKAYIMTPGIQKKWHPMDIWNLKQQSMYIDKLFAYMEKAQEIAETKVFPVGKGYCGSCGFKEYCKQDYLKIEVII